MGSFPPAWFYVLVLKMCTRYNLIVLMLLEAGEAKPWSLDPLLASNLRIEKSSVHSFMSIAQIFISFVLIIKAKRWTYPIRLRFDLWGSWRFRRAFQAVVWFCSSIGWHFRTQSAVRAFSLSTAITNKKRHQTQPSGRKERELWAPYGYRRATRSGWLVPGVTKSARNGNKINQCHHISQVRLV